MFIDFFWCSLHQRGKVLPDFTTMPTPFFQSAGAGRFQEIPKLLSGQEKLGADVAVVEWIIETDRFPCVCHTLELSVKKGCDIPEIS